MLLCFSTGYNYKAYIYTYMVMVITIILYFAVTSLGRRSLRFRFVAMQNAIRLGKMHFRINFYVGLRFFFNAKLCHTATIAKCSNDFSSHVSQYEMMFR